MGAAPIVLAPHLHVTLHRVAAHHDLRAKMRSAQQLADRNALYPNFGYLFPEGAEKVRKAFNETTVRAALEPSASGWPRI